MTPEYGASTENRSSRASAIPVCAPPREPPGMLGSAPCDATLDGMGVMTSRFLGPRYWPTWVGLGVLRLVERLPFASLLCVGRCLGRLARRAPLPYARVARRNIELCLPELSLD